MAGERSAGDDSARRVNISMSLRNLGRTAMVVAVALAGLAVASPAKAAAPLSVNVSCEALSRQRVLCLSTTTGGTAPYSQRWFYDSRRFPSHDGRSVTSWSCTPGGENLYTLAVIDGNFEIVFATSRTGCSTGNQ
jgi:hypothetical protein